MEKWLFQNVSKYSDDKNKDLVDQLFNELINFLNKHEEIYLEEDIETFRILFYNFIYNKYS
mgnify:CR=1 FL=1